MSTSKGPDRIDSHKPSFISDNVKRMLATFVPANNMGEANKLNNTIGVMSHGSITFADNKSNRAQFIRIPPNAPVIHVKELLNRFWCKAKPSLVISITGGAKDYNMKPKLLRAFRRGLLKVARTTGAWIITGGMNTGIMKLVGEIVQINPDRSRPIHLIGIATWGCVAGNQQLDVHGSNVHYTKPRIEEKGAASLEPNHTEFVLIDDGSERKYGREIEFRAQLEQAISGDFFGCRPTTSTNAAIRGTASLQPGASDSVPAVLLVIEGGPNTVRTVHEAVVQNNIPAVFFEGTGRCCDLFSKASNLYNEYRKEFQLTDDASSGNESDLQRRYGELKNKLREALVAELREIDGSSNEAKGGFDKKSRKLASTTNNDNNQNDNSFDYFELVYECIHTRRNFLNIVSLNPRSLAEPDIDLAILKALLNATSGVDSAKSENQRKREQFHLALEWNRVDIARDHIMKNDKDWQKVNLNDMFEVALERNQTEFVKLFLEHDFALTEIFRNNGKLPLLYLRSLQKTFDCHRATTDPLRTIYREIIQPLIGDFFEVDVAVNPSGHVLDGESDDDIETCSSCIKSRPDRTRKIQSTSEVSQSEALSECLMDIDKELFLWSVVTGRTNFNLLFWIRGKNKICAALIAALIYRKRAKKDNDNSHYQVADEFEDLASKILNRFYHVDPRTCTKAIIRKIPAYGNVTWLELAITAEAKQFIAQRAVQDVLNNIWFGFIDQRESDWKIIFSTIMLWYSGFLLYHDELVKTNPMITFNKTLGTSSLFKDKSSTYGRNTTDERKNEVRLRLLYGTYETNNDPVEFVDVGCFEKSRTRVQNYFKNILYFLRAPYVKYLYNLYFHMVFLLLFTYVILCDFFPLYEFSADLCSSVVEIEQSKSNGSNDKKNIPYGLEKHDMPSITEWILVIWVSTLLCEEIRQFFSSEAQSIRNAILAYFQVFWNILDFLAILFFYIGITLRFLPSAECFCAARIVLSVDLTLWFIRTLDIFAAVKRLGPKLVMIGEMANDMKMFMVMLTIFILGFGVSIYGLIHGVKQFSWHLPREIISVSYWEIFGELTSLDSFKDNYKANGYAAFILLLIYMAITSILLVNLLIAMLSNTFDRLQTDTDRIWKFQRYSLICEYLSRPSLPPPLILLSHLSRLLLVILKTCIRSPWLIAQYAQHKKRTKYQIKLDEKLVANIEIAEDALGDEVYSSHIKMHRTPMDQNYLDEGSNSSTQGGLAEKIRTIEHRLLLLNNQQNYMVEYLDCLFNGFKDMVGEQFQKPEQRRFDPDESFEEGNTSGGPAGDLIRRRDLLLATVGHQSSVHSDDISPSVFH